MVEIVSFLAGTWIAHFHPSRDSVINQLNYILFWGPEMHDFVSGQSVGVHHLQPEIRLHSGREYPILPPLKFSKQMYVYILPK